MSILEGASLDSIAEDCREKLISYRRYLHMHPELSFREEKTAGWIREHLGACGIRMAEGISGNSTVGILEGEEPGPSLLFRADIDALPIDEDTGLSFASQEPGVMHACGHDAHTAVLLCFAEFLAAHRELIKGTVKLVFQQGEELVPGGGSFIVGDGVLDDVDYVFAWHCAPEHESGRVIVSGGPRTASFNNFEIIVTGRGGHGGFPHRCDNAIGTGALIVSAVESLPMRTVDPMDSVTMIISRFDSGTHGVYNIIPGEARIEGNIRSLNTASARILLDRVQTAAENICRASGCECSFIRHEGYPALYNDPALAETVRRALAKEGIDAAEAGPVMGAEDFAFYTQKRPGLYINVGTRNPEDQSTFYPPHNPLFCIDESALVTAFKSLLSIYRRMAAGGIIMTGSDMG